MNEHSSEVIEFMNLFARLREYCDDDPNILLELKANDESVREICGDIREKVETLRSAEYSGSRRFTAPVDPKFTSAWRDYEDRFERVILEGCFISYAHERLSTMDEGAWDVANYDAHIISEGIEIILEQSYDLILEKSQEEDDPSSFPPHCERELGEGLYTLKILGEDPEGPFVGISRRLSLIPFVQIPRHVAKRYGSNQKLSLYEFLEQAQSVFVFGAHLAALALMRTIMEVVLRDHYGAESGDLGEKINFCQKRLPKGANVAALHRLRRISNAVLHSDESSNVLNFDLSDTKSAEIDIVILLNVLRILIESAPQR